MPGDAADTTQASELGYILFEELHGKQCAMTDISSLGQLMDAFQLGVLTRAAETIQSETFPRVSKEEALSMHAKWLRDNVGTASMRVPLELLARCVVYDYLVLDHAAFLRMLQVKRLGGVPRPLADLFRLVNVEQSVYNAAVSSFNKVRGALQYAGLHHWMATGGNGEIPFDSLEQEAFNVKPEVVNPEVREMYLYNDAYSRMASSEDPVPRTFFYAELAREARVPLVLHPQKKAIQAKFFTELGAKNELQVPDVFGKLQDFLDEQLVGTWNAKGFTFVLEHPLPPVAEYIVRISERQGRSLIEAALMLRDDPNAKEFRSWLHEVERGFLSGHRDRSRIMKAALKWKELEAVVEKWKQTFNLDEGVRHRWMDPKPLYRLIPFGLGPAVEAAMGNRKIRDLILDQRPYLAFIADLFKHEHASD